MAKVIDATEISLREYLSKTRGQINIPFTQRPYTWERENVEKLLEDILMVYENRDEKYVHLVNFFTFYNQDGNMYIYDGQQRTITLVLILMNLIKLLKDDILNQKISPDDVKKAKQSHDKLIEEHICSEPTDLRSKDKIWKLNFENGSSANDVFRALVDNKNLKNMEMDDYVKNFISNNRIIKNKINEYLEDKDVDKYTINDMISSMLDNIILVYVSTTNESIAKAMFESLNSTGQQVEHYYVLKNALFEKLSNQHEEIWKQIDTYLNGLNKSEFLKAVATMYNGKTNSKNSLDVIRKQGLYDNPNSALGFITTLKEYSHQFYRIKNPMHFNKNSGEKALSRSLIDISLFGFKQHVPLILALIVSEYSFEDILKVAEMVKSRVIINIFLANERTNSVENLIADLTKDVFTKKISIVSIISKISKDIFNEDQLKSYIKAREFKSGSDFLKIKYILSGLYDLDLGGEVKTNRDFSKIWIEHIIPQNPKEDSLWIQTFGERIDNYINNLGNITLLLDKNNGKASNGEFVSKKELYLKSEYVENRKIASNENWTNTEVEERAAGLGTKIIGNWGVKNTSHS